MQIIINLPNEEANRQVECEEENIRPAYQEIIRKIEDVCAMHQIRYDEILIRSSDA